MKIQNNKDRILYLLKTRGAQTAVTVAKELHMTSMGARQLLQELEKLKLVNTYNEKASRGRPKKMWQLTAEAASKFPDRHADVMVDLLAATRAQFGEAGIEVLIKSRESQMYKKYCQAIDSRACLKEQVKQLAAVRSTEGYMAEVVDDHEGLFLIENHCPICVAAESCQQFCRSELQLFSQLLEARVERVEYLLHGDRRCVYKISG